MPGFVQLLLDTFPHDAQQAGRLLLALIPFLPLVVLVRLVHAKSRRARASKPRWIPKDFLPATAVITAFAGLVLLWAFPVDYPDPVVALLTAVLAWFVFIRTK